MGQKQSKIYFYQYENNVIIVGISLHKNISYCVDLL